MADAAPQTDEGASYAAKIERSETTIDWRQNAAAIDRRIRAFNPVPGAQTTLAGKALKIWDAEATAGRFGGPGTIGFEERR